jgi:alpha-L-fucosidase 2
MFRGDPSAGWSMNWKICSRARSLDLNRVYKLIKDQVSLVEEPAGGLPGH